MITTEITTERRNKYIRSIKKLISKIDWNEQPDCTMDACVITLEDGSTRLQKTYRVEGEVVYREKLR